MPIGEFFSLSVQNPLLLLVTALVAGVVFVNGWTDAPNAIATCVGSGAMRLRPAVLMATACNLMGVVTMMFVSRGVAQTVFHIADFGDAALPALCAAMFGIIVWAVAAWYFGIPTSESHALIAGVSGAALAVGGTLDGGEWAKVIGGLLLSAAFGFLGGLLSARPLVRRETPKNHKTFTRLQIASGAGMAFMHGAQDGQKFIGVFLLAMSLSGASDAGETPFWMLLCVALLMGLGTLCGGGRIIKTVGSDMVRLTAASGFAADLSATVVLLVCTLLSWPVSTTHVKTTAIMGAGISGGAGNPDKKIMRDMVLAWVLTFPVCGLISYFLTLLAVR